ncbi:MAG: signal peptidase I [Propionibacteriaceae bacterium]|nr:signal peptidase I [Propionibacteriaceae bacterium]
MTERPSVGRRLLGGLKDIVLVVLGALIISALLRAFVFEPFTIPTESMENTLQVQDKVIAQKVTDFKRGDVIVFQDPGQWVTGASSQRRTNPAARVLEFVGVLPNSSHDFLTKRVIGLPGDRVSCCDADGRLMINGLPLDESDYVFPDSPVRASSTEFDVVVPRNHLFVLGDHRNASADSRCHMQDDPTGMSAFVPIDNVVGPVGLIVAPFERWQQLRTPGAFAGVPEPTREPPTAPEILTAAHC